MINRGRATLTAGMPTLTCMNGVGAIRRWWRHPPARDAVLALAITAALLFGAYGEAHPSNPTAYFNGGHHLPAYPHARVASSSPWRPSCSPGGSRWPVAVLGVSVAAATVYTLLGYVNGAALVAPMIALYTVAAQLASGGQ